MESQGGRNCDGCGQPLPGSAKLARETVSREEAQEYNSNAPANPDGTVTIDLCLACRIRRAEARKGSG
jgi:hypothetical protein